MKPTVKTACCGLAALLLVPAAGAAYDNSIARVQIVPEVIWAPATGGGTWVTQLQVTAIATGATITATFFYGTASRTVTLATTTSDYHALKYENILATMQDLDPSFTYFGQVGALWISSQDDSHKLFAQAMTVNGNYAKTYPGLGWTDGNSVNYARPMAIPNIQQNATYRTFVGFLNASSDAAALEVQFYLMDPIGYTTHGQFTKTFLPWEFKAFNPYVEAGLGTGYEVANSWLWIHVVSPERPATGLRGLICFGSTANNVTNDPAALIAIPFN